MANPSKPPVLLSNGAKLLTFCLFSLLFTFFFYNKDLGLNFLFVDVIVIIWLLFTRQLRFNGTIPAVAFSAFVLTSVFTIITHSVFVYIMHFISIFILAGALIHPAAGSMLTTAGLAVSNIFLSFSSFTETLTTGSKSRSRIGRIIRRSLIFIVPMAIIFIFIAIYSASNPKFNALVLQVTDFLGKYFDWFFRNINMQLFVTFILVAFFLAMLMFRKGAPKIVQYDTIASDRLERRRKRNIWSSKWLALKNEFRAGIFLFFILNALLLLVNIIDINWVWFNFKWEGQYLKQFVHEGTYLLILSILISIGLVLYFFRGNQNFYSGNKWLRILSYIWLGQNAILAVSVGIRNFYYIQNFALAYKRIGVILFLLLTLYGLYTVFLKVKNTRSAYFLFRKNTLAAYVLLVLASLVNWDAVIAKYNFSHYQKSFLHLNFMADLSDKALPYLDVPVEKLTKIDSTQQKKFDFADRYYYMTPAEYTERISSRINEFLAKWESKDFLEWNYAEYKAYRDLRHLR